jgi:hypothetical protein
MNGKLWPRAATDRCKRAAAAARASALLEFHPLPSYEDINALITLTDVNEEIGPAVVPLDKAESFVFFEELHCALHRYLLP